MVVNDEEADDALEAVDEAVDALEAVDEAKVAKPL